jgi:hypothetical protein
MDMMTTAAGRRTTRRRTGTALLLATILALSACGTPPTPTPAPAVSRQPRTSASPPVPSAFRCASPAGATDTNRTHAQLPNCAGHYDQHEGEAITHAGNVGLEVFMTALDAAELVFAVEQPELVAFLEAAAYAGAFAECAQEKGIANWRIYTAKGEPRAAGIVLVASDKQLKARTLLCVLESIPVPRRAQSLPPQFSPCSDRFSYQAEGDTFYVVYAATRQDLCQDFRVGFGL